MQKEAKTKQKIYLYFILFSVDTLFYPVNTPSEACIFQKLKHGSKAALSLWEMEVCT